MQGLFCGAVTGHQPASSYYTYTVNVNVGVVTVVVENLVFLHLYMNLVNILQR